MRPTAATPHPGADRARDAGSGFDEVEGGAAHAVPPQGPVMPQSEEGAGTEGESPASKVESAGAGPPRAARETSGEDGGRLKDFRDAAPARTAWTKRAVAGLLGLVLLVFFLWAFIYAPEQLPSFKQRILAIVSALLCGFFTFFLTGAIGTSGKGLRTPVGEISLDATGGVAVFVLVLVWWLTPLAPVAADEKAATGGPAQPEDSPQPHKELTAVPFAPLTLRSQVNSIALDSAGGRAIVAEENGAVQDWKVGSGRPAQKLTTS